MSDEIPFVPFPKIARLSRNVVVTEKIDGTNAQVFIDDLGTSIRAGSRSRWITPKEDNHGFARWVEEHQDELMKLGPGSHFGEWWGAGIQRRYGLSEKRFSLFNVSRWGPGGKEVPPECCHVVPVLWQGQFDDFNAEERIDNLIATLFKKTVKGDEKPKGSKEEG